MEANAVKNWVYSPTTNENSTLSPMYEKEMGKISPLITPTIFAFTSHTKIFGIPVSNKRLVLFALRPVNML